MIFLYRNINYAKFDEQAAVRNCRGLRIRYYDAAGKEIIPTGSVAVRITSDEIAGFKAPVLFAVLENAQKKTYTAKIQNPVALEDEYPDEVRDNENTLSFRTDIFENGTWLFADQYVQTDDIVNADALNADEIAAGNPAEDQLESLDQSAETEQSESTGQSEIEEGSEDLMQSAMDPASDAVEMGSKTAEVSLIAESFSVYAIAYCQYDPTDRLIRRPM